MRENQKYSWWARCFLTAAFLTIFNGLAIGQTVPRLDLQIRLTERLIDAFIAGDHELQSHLSEIVISPDPAPARATFENTARRYGFINGAQYVKTTRSIVRVMEGIEGRSYIEPREHSIAFVERYVIDNKLSGAAADDYRIRTRASIDSRYPVIKYHGNITIVLKNFDRIAKAVEK